MHEPQWHFEGSWPEWCISSVIYSRDTTFWSGTVDLVCDLVLESNNGLNASSLSFALLLTAFYITFFLTFLFVCSGRQRSRREQGGSSGVGVGWTLSYSFWLWQVIMSLPLWSAYNGGTSMTVFLKYSLEWLSCFILTMFLSSCFSLWVKDCYRFQICLWPV